MMRLGIMTCQRGSDLIRMGPEHRDRNGLWCRPRKTRKRRRAFHIPLGTADALEIDPPQSITEKSRTQPRGFERFAVRSNATATIDTSQIEIPHCRAT
jgi:hypothetical protein